MKSAEPKTAGDLRMKAADFERIMRGALGVHAPPPEPKTAKPKKRAVAKTVKKTAKR